MSEETTTPLAVFGDPESGWWGLLIGDEHPRIAVARGERSEPDWLEVSLDTDDGQVWLLTGDGNPTDLKLELAAASSSVYEDGSALAPCRLTGSAGNDGGTTELDLPGVLIVDLPTGKVESTRLLGSWFPAGDEISLLSVRPKGAKGQDADHVDAIGRGEEYTLIFDPRLSTTYGPDGHPRKAGIELWLGDDENGDQHPRRVSGVCSGGHISTEAGGSSVHAYTLHCLSRADAGMGVYVLITPA